MASSANSSLLRTITYFSRLHRHALRPSQRVTMWRPFSSTTRTLSLSSLQSSSSSTPPSPFTVRSSHLLSSSYTFPSNVKVKVWWDFDTCELPTGVSVSQVLPIITAALKANGINGPIEMYARGNINNLSIENQEAISTSGIDFEHIGIRDPLCESPKRRQHRVYRAIINDPFWCDYCDPPLHVFYISGYDGLAFHVPWLVEENYHMLVASTGPDKDLFFRFANISFDWNSLIRGENLIGHRREFYLEDYKALVASTIRENDEKKEEERERKRWRRRERERDGGGEGGVDAEAEEEGEEGD